MCFFQVPWLPEALLRWGGCEAIGECFTRVEAGGCRNPEALTQEVGVVGGCGRWVRWVGLRPAQCCALAV